MHLATMKSRRVHVTGASGVGVTTLGRALADALAVSHHDTDDYYWLPSPIPYSVVRSAKDRLRLMREVFLDESDWILSGSLDGWGDELTPLFDLVVFVTAPSGIRETRLRDREARRFGADAVSPGGWRHEAMEEFVEWASHYEDGTREGRKLDRHEAWLAILTCPVVRLDGSAAISDLVRAVAEKLEENT